MKIIIKNFRCYIDKTFVFEDPFTFVLGKSGAGKTTLLDAIVFALYGKAKNCSSILTDKSPSVEIHFGEFIISRTKTNLVARVGPNTFSDSVAQRKIEEYFGRKFLYYSQTNSSLFLEMAPRDQLEFIEDVLFNQEIDIKEIKGRFVAEKRALDSLTKDLMTKKSLTLEFIKKIGPTTQLTAFSADMDSRALQHKRAFLRNRIQLWNSFNQRVVELKRDIGNLQAQIERSATLSRTKVPYDKRELERHIEAEKRLRGINIEKYAGYTVEECDEEIQEYEKEKAVLSQAMTVHKCPYCEGELNVQNGRPIKVSVSSETIQTLLEELGAENTSEALCDIERQLRLYREYKAKRILIDENKGQLLPIGNASELLSSLRGKEKYVAELGVLKGLLSLKEKQLEKLEKVAQELDAHTWAKHREEVSEISEFLSNAQLYELKLKEEKISAEYRSQLKELEEKVALCSARQAGLARASAIFADTEQEYLFEMIKSLVEKMNLYISQVFDAPFEFQMGIEAVKGARKLKISFIRDGQNWTYEMFSGGEKARLNICMLLVLANCQQYKLLLLDELTRSLDKEAIGKVIAVLRANFGGQILVTEHQEIEGEGGVVSRAI